MSLPSPREKVNKTLKLHLATWLGNALSSSSFSIDDNAEDI
jgi:hypothetical protein